ncbi:hypothetical protein OEZ85_000248 [Tetradesmus obliquus]|uniref:CCHC-type domain-containing protein n=1 Tax=Tetradesmus obliquus TaxID=3088 RepID=A0ABY8UVF0_TETOB|nr:hypothetical protein OEZ85_000248 [Tetradesmus obliquus]
MSHKRARYESIALVERDAAEEDESSEEEDDDDEQEQEPEIQAQQAKPSKISVALRTGSGLVCHVCGQRGHKAGFVGAVYMDCPNKPCYLCKQPGHTTASCPHNMSVNAAAAPAAAGGGRGGSASPAHLLLRREQTGQQRRGPLTTPASPPWQVEAAILKLHSRRVCCLAFPDNSDSHVLSGDKKGQVAVWNFTQVHDRTIYSNIHRALVNSIRFASWLPGGFSCASASSDGTVKLFDVETGASSELLNLNPSGWSRGCAWHMFYGADANRELRLVLAGDSDGKVHLLDPRAAGGALSSLQLHKPGSKVNAVAVNPAGGASVVLTAGNDHTAKLFDVRKLSSIKPPASDPPPSAAAAAAAAAAAVAASPGSGRGRQILTTCQDNRLRVWSNLLACDGPPSREIVHSHDFNRYLTPFKAEWFPSDPSECRIICGRYISEDFGGVALHPVDIIDAGSGRLLQQLTDLNLNTITPVNLPHPRLDIIISGSSRSLYKWVPQPDDEDDADNMIDQRTDRPGSSAAAAAAADLVRRAAASSSFVAVDADPGGKGSKAAGSGGKTKTKQAAAAGTSPAAGKRKAATPAKGAAGNGRAKAGRSSSISKAKRRASEADDSDDDDVGAEEEGVEDDSD